MKREDIELDYGYSEHKPNPLGCDVWINCTDERLGTKVMDKGVVLDSIWWENLIKLGKHIHKKKIMI